jgi:hypothetical protein
MRGRLVLTWAFVSNALLALVAGSGCRSRRPPAPAPPPPPLLLGPILIQAAPSDEQQSAPAPDGAAIAGRLRSVLLDSGLVVAPKPGSSDAGASGSSAPGDERSSGTGPGTLRIMGLVATEMVEVDRKGLCRAGVSLKVDTRPSDAPGALDEDLSATGEERFEITAAGGPDRGALAQRLAERTATDLLSGLLARARLRRATPAELHAAIVGDGGAGPVREEAIRLAGQRGLTAEAPALLPLLDDPEESIRDAALGALIALRDQRAVAQLARHRSLRDRREMTKILEAISQIGGEEAEQYLSFVADAHEDADIRQQAREAHDRVLRHRGAEDSGPGPQRP